MLVEKHDNVDKKKNMTLWLRHNLGNVATKNILTRKGPESCFTEIWIALNKNDPLNSFKTTTTKTLTVV